MVIIKVENKVAENITKDEFWVCGNTDYQVKFEFDEVWNSHELKTALFAFNGVAVPVPFTGNVCEVPKLLDCTICQVGVFAGDLITTTPALVGCKRSITDIGGEIPPPQDDVYEKLVTMIESGMLKGEKGDKGDKGEKGDAGAIKFITVVSLPTENIDESAIYLVPIENPDGENRFTEYAYIDGKWETLGAISIQVDHSEYVKFTDYANGTTAGVVYTPSGAWNGININKGIPQIIPATKGQIDAKTTSLFAIVPSNGDYFLRKSITTNTETLTDEEKTSACEWIGAIQNTKPSGRNYGDGVVLTFNSTGKLAYTPLYGVYIAGLSIPYRDSEGVLHANTPTTGTGLTPKEYVDGKIAELVARIEALENK